MPQQSSMVEIWRSESVIQVFIDFWLSYGEREVSLYGVQSRVRKVVVYICQWFSEHTWNTFREVGVTHSTAPFYTRLMH